MLRWAILVLAALTLLTCGAGGASGSATGAPTAQLVIAKLRAAGLPVGKAKVYNAFNDGTRLLGRPGQYTGKVNFRDMRIKDAGGGFAVSSGGSIEIFATRADAKRRAGFVSAIFASASPSIPSEYDYLVGNAFLRLSHVLTPTQAQRYEAVLRRLLTR